MLDRCVDLVVLCIDSISDRANLVRRLIYELLETTDELGKAARHRRPERWLFALEHNCLQSIDRRLCLAARAERRDTADKLVRHPFGF